ncbi:hypothetical protein Q763_06800 [Flavobacterium beibuense F44-8]|uniref:Uncharacterized protein n=1 Tax=Flavobacterium beibuense F44-8 TaxID=1406840 RepID=A0A0A2M0T3_9FLAO|nr:hypothetical protein [Flavobacterium beibuense]KGO81970.1 hypothetical protein Q763_06800 [Flavobacterium beibuense F44-8]
MRQLLAILFFLSYSALQAQSLEEINKQLESDIKQINYWYYEASANSKYDSLEAANIQFEKHLLKVLNNNPETLYHNFDTIIHTVSSPDKKLRAYSWDTNMGGTMRDFQTVFQYQTKNGVKAEKLTGKDNEPEDAIYWCNAIHSFKTKQQTIYIAVIYAKLSSIYSYTTVLFFTTENDSLTEIPSLIETDENGDTPGIEYNFLSTIDNPNAPDELIDFDPKKFILRFAKTDDDGNVTNSFNSYKFNGEYFKKVN